MTREAEIAYIALMTAFVVVLRFVPPIALPIGVPITAQSMGIMLAGILLGPWRGFLSLALFVVMALLGLPVLASGAAGPSILTSPSVGFILGFPFAALITGWITSKLTHYSVFTAGLTGAILGAIVFLYIPGVFGLKLITGLSFMDATKAMLPYIPGDIIKAFLAAFIAEQLYHIRPQYVMTRSEKPRPHSH